MSLKDLYRRYPIKPTCEVCGKERRWRYQYCSNACKQKAYRDRKKSKDVTTSSQ